MAINYHIKDGTGSSKLARVKETDYGNALVVANIPLDSYEYDVRFFGNPTYGTNLNLNASTSGSNELVHNGNDDTLWTATTVVGNDADFDFSSTDQANTGTQSINCSNAEGGDVFQLTDIIEHSFTDFSSFTGYVYVTGLWTLPDDGLEIVLWNTSSGTQVSSNSVDLDNYVDGGNEDVWQSFSIPMSDFGTSTSFDSMRFTMLEDGSPPNFYLDDLQFIPASGSGPTEFTVRPSIGETLYIDDLTVIMADTYATTLTDSTMPRIPYDSFLGVSSLDNGILTRIFQNNEITFSRTIRQLSDFLMLSHAKIEDYGSDGTNTWFKIYLKPIIPIVLHDLHDDYISIVINDNLSGLDLFRVSVGCRVRI